MENQVRAAQQYKVDSELNWRDKFVLGTVKAMTGYNELVEFEDTEEVNRTLLPVNKKPRKRYLLKILKRTLSFIVFGIENVLNKSNKKKPTIQVPNRYENRFKDNRQIK